MVPQSGEEGAKQINFRSVGFHNLDKETMSGKRSLDSSAIIHVEFDVLCNSQVCLDEIKKDSKDPKKEIKKQPPKKRIRILPPFTEW